MQLVDSAGAPLGHKKKNNDINQQFGAVWSRKKHY